MVHQPGRSYVVLVDGPSGEVEAGRTGDLLASGFGQRDEYIEVIGMVKNTSTKVGQTVTPLKSPGVQVVCYNAAKKIIGGAFTFPDLIPASGKAAVDLDLLVADKPEPASCTAYAEPPVVRTPLARLRSKADARSCPSSGVGQLGR